MPNWKKVIVSGSNAILSNITASGDISASGDIYATNFYGNFEGTASIASAVTITELDSPAFFNVLFTNGSNLFATDNTYGDFVYNPSSNTLQVDNIVGTASLATTSSYALTASLATTSTTSSYALTASYVEGAVSINGNTNNNILTATGTDTIQGESNLTFNGSTLNINGGITVNPQGYLGFIDLSASPGGASVNIGDENQSNNGTFFKVDDENSNITFNFDDPVITHTVTSTGFNITGNITASNDISASGDVYADNVRTDTIIFPNVGGKITTPDGQINDDYVTLDGTNRYFSVVLDATDLLKVDFNNELITLGESTKHGSATNDTHQFTGSVDIKGNTNIDGNLVINGDITAEQYIVNSTVTNVTMSFSSGSTIFGDSLDDTHLFTGSVDITGSLTVEGITYPTTDGDNGDVLITDGAGNLSFTRTTVYANVKNVSGGELIKGYPVHVTGTTGNTSEVIAASASNADTMPAHFILNETLADNAEGLAIAVGYINGINTIGFTEGDTVYVAADGGYTNVKPIGSNLIQNLGIVDKVAENGSGFILGAGRSNDVPNLPVGKIWVGSSTYSVTSSVIHLDESNNRLGINTDNPTYQLHVSSSTAALGVYERAGGAALYLEGQETRGVMGTVGSHPLLIAYNSGEVARFTGTSFLVTGSLDVSTSITASGNISASGYVSADHLILNPNTTTTGSNDTETQIDISLGDEEYKRGVIKRVFDFRENLVSADDVNINNQVIADIGEFKKGTLDVTIELNGYRPDSESFNTNTASLNQNIKIHTVPTTTFQGSAVDILLEEGASFNSFLPLLNIGTIIGEVPPNQFILYNSLLKIDNEQIKFNVSDINNANILLSSSLAIVYIDYQLYK